MRTGHGHDLSPVGGIGQHFLIAGHGRVEHDFASGLPFCSEGPSFEPGAVGERFELGRAGFHHREELGAAIAANEPPEWITPPIAAACRTALQAATFAMTLETDSYEEGVYPELYQITQTWQVWTT